MASAKTIRRQGDPDPHRKAPLDHGDYFTRDTWHETPAARPVGSLGIENRQYKPN
jgi:hypothetical protein